MLDAMVFVARAKGSVGFPEVRTIYQALVLLGSGHADRIMTLKRLLGTARARIPVRFPEMRGQLACMWLLSQLLDLSEDAQGSVAAEFLSEFALHIGLAPTTKEVLLAKVKQSLSFGNLMKLTLAATEMGIAYKEKSGVAAFRKAVEHRDVFSEVTDRLRIPVRVIRKSSRLRRSLLKWRKQHSKRTFGSMNVTDSPGTDLQVLLRSYARALTEDLSWLTRRRFLEWPSARKFREAGARFLTTLRSEVPALTARRV